MLERFTWLPLNQFKRRSIFKITVFKKKLRAFVFVTKLPTKIVQSLKNKNKLLIYMGRYRSVIAAFTKWARPKCSFMK